MLFFPIFVLVQAGLAPASDRQQPFEMAAQLDLPGGITIRIPDGQKKRAPRRQRRTQPADGWQHLAAINGQGTAVCNTSGDLYSCLAFRCGRGRGLEFAFLYNVGDYTNAPSGRFIVDGEVVAELPFTTINPEREMVAAYVPENHAPLIERMRAGRTLSFDIGFTHNFSLRGSKREIDSALAACAWDDNLLAASPDQTNTTDRLAWRVGDTAASHISRIRESAVSFGGPCDAEGAILNRIQREIDLSLDRDQAYAGKAVTATWSAYSPDEPIPAYLIVSANHPVRLQGVGFYALMPGAKAQFGIETFKENTRAVVPLYRHENRGGRLSIIPLLAGKLDIEWSVVGYLRGCQQELSSAFGKAQVTVKAGGVPVIVVENEASLTDVTERIGLPEDSALAGRVIEVREGRYRLIDQLSGAEIAERAGREPRFSPTGRFVAAESDDGMEVIDAVDGALIYKQNAGGPLAWHNADSFAVVGLGPWGSLEVVSPVHQGRVVVNSGAIGCHACSGFGTGVRIDLENELVALGERGAVAERLSASGAPSAESKSAAELLRQYQLSPFSPSATWDLGPIVQFTHGYATEFPSTVLQPRLLGEGEQFAAAAGAPLQRAEWRSFAMAGARTAGSERALLRISEFGVPITKDLAELAEGEFASELTVLSDDPEGGYFEDSKFDAMRAVAGKIRMEVPEAGAALVDSPREEMWACGPADSHWDDKTKVFTVLKIHSRFQRAYRFSREGRVVWLTHEKCVQGSAAFSSPSVALFDSENSAAWFIEQETGDPGLGENRTGAHGECFVSIADCNFDARIVGDRLLVLSSRLSRAVEIYDIDARINLFKKYNLPRGDLLQHVAVTDNGRGVLQVNSDGSFFLYAMADAQLLLEGRYVDDEVVVWTPEMRFDSTIEGAHFVNLKFPGRPGQYTFQQFDSRLRVENLSTKVLSGEHDFETVAVGVPPRLSGTLRAEGGRIVGEVTPESPGELRGIRVYQDGVTTNEVLALFSGEPVRIDVARLPGARWISLVAVDEDGLASLPVGRDVGPDKRGPAKVHLLAIGIDEYDNEDITDLELAVSDANLLKKSLEELSGKSIDLMSQVVLTDHEAGAEGVLAAAENLVAAAKPGEMAVFFFAGHGVKGEDGRYYMATSKTDPDNISQTSLSWDALSAILAKSRARMTVFLDSCHSGAAGTDFFATNDDAASGILKNIPSGLTVFSASKGRELSEENPDVGGGVFTRALTSVIAGERASHDLNHNGAIEVSELYVGVKRRVVEQTDARQTPWLARNQMIGDFSLF